MHGFFFVAGVVFLGHPAEEEKKRKRGLFVWDGGWRSKTKAFFRLRRREKLTQHRFSEEGKL